MAARPDEERITSPRRLNDSSRPCLLHAIHWDVHPHFLLLGYQDARRDNRLLVTGASLGLEGSGCIFEIRDLEGAWQGSFHPLIHPQEPLHIHAGAAGTSMGSEQEEDMAMWMEGEEPTD